MLTRALGALVPLPFDREPVSLISMPTRISSAMATITATHSHAVGQCMNDRLERLSSLCCAVTHRAYSPPAERHPRSEGAVKNGDLDVPHVSVILEQFVKQVARNCVRHIAHRGTGQLPARPLTVARSRLP